METVQSELTQAARALMLLRAEMSQREARMSAALEEQTRSLQQATDRFRADIAGLVDKAGAQIAQEAKHALVPATAQYQNAVSSTTARLHATGKTIWLWFGIVSATLLLVLLVAWSVLGYYRRELGTTKAELQRYENAASVVQAFDASDAILCGGRVCANAEPKGKRYGDKGQYRQVRPRPPE